MGGVVIHCTGKVGWWQQRASHFADCEWRAFHSAIRLAELQTAQGRQQDQSGFQSHPCKERPSSRLTQPHSQTAGGSGNESNLCDAMNTQLPLMQDVVDLSTGEDIHKFVDLFRDVSHYHNDGGGQPHPHCHLSSQ